MQNSSSIIIVLFTVEEKAFGNSGIRTHVVHVINEKSNLDSASTTQTTTAALAATTTAAATEKTTAMTATTTTVATSATITAKKQ